MSNSLLLVGGGKMGGALLSGWLTQGTDPSSIIIVEPDSDSRDRYAETGVAAIAEIDALPTGFEPRVIVFAVKPQVMDEVVPAYEKFRGGRAFYLSIAAGKPIAFFEGALGVDAAVVRTMPNTPAAVGRGITVLCANAHVDQDAKTIAQRLLGAVGETAWIEDESLMDAVTAVSGSGPAYVFHLVECLAQAGVHAGLPSELAARLARATVSGAGELAYRDPTPADVLRRNVTSPGGTTEAALNVLMGDDALKDLIERAVTAATERSRELGG